MSTLIIIERRYCTLIHLCLHCPLFIKFVYGCCFLSKLYLLFEVYALTCTPKASSNAYTFVLAFS